MTRYTIALKTNGLTAYFNSETADVLMWVYTPENAMDYELEVASSIAHTLSELEIFEGSEFEIKESVAKHIVYELVADGYSVWLTTSKASAYRRGLDVRSDYKTVLIRRRNLETSGDGEVVYTYI